MNRSEIERGVEAMSTWSGGERRLWSTALERARGQNARPAWRLPRPGGRAAAVLLAAVGLAVLLTGALRGGGAPLPGAVREGVSFDQHLPAPSDQSLESVVRYSYAGKVVTDGALHPEPGDSAPESVVGDAARQIARTASVSLRSDDVRATVEAVRGIIDRPAGEFIEGVTISGQGGEATGRVTLRVLGDRLEDVLARVRGLGDVVSEQVTASDVTDQLVDTEARLRNERRIEEELLKLIDTQDKIDVSGLVRLRSELGSVRERIERMEATQRNTQRLVSLSTVRVDVRGRDVSPAVESGWRRFWRNAGAYWSSGVRTLGRSLGGVLAFVVGRVLWWVPAVVMLVVAWRLWRRRGGGA